MNISIEYRVNGHWANGWTVNDISFDGELWKASAPFQNTWIVDNVIYGSGPTFEEAIRNLREKLIEEHINLLKEMWPAKKKKKPKKRKKK